MYKRSVPLAIVLLIAILVVAMIPQPTTTTFVLKADKRFYPSEVTYANKTMPFEVGDVYGGYSYWTLSDGGVQGFDNINAYVTDCDAEEFEFFGFDEFVNHSYIYAETEFQLIYAPTATFDVVALGYFYQKTALNENNHWALAIACDETGFYLVHNTDDGNEPTNTSISAETFEEGTKYFISIENAGDGWTDIIIEETTYPYDFSYTGSIATGTYDAKSLYAGFGNTAYFHINVWTYNYYLTISDTILSFPSDGTGFYKIGAYIDEIYTHTFFDLDGVVNSSLDIDTTVSNITLLIECWLNSTTYGVSTVAEGANIIRHNVTVTNRNSTIVFAQSNFTYIVGSDYGDGLFLYQYSVLLDFTPRTGNIYTTVVTYEIYY